MSADFTPRVLSSGDFNTVKIAANAFGADGRVVTLQLVEYQPGERVMLDPEEARRVAEALMAAADYAEANR